MLCKRTTRLILLRQRPCNMQLPTPSAEQQEAITAIQSGKCVTINAVAGSGKTTTMLQIASNLSSHRHATILTYNRTLKDECREKILRLNTALNNNIQCYTIHGFVSKLVGEIVNDDNKLNKVVRRWDEEEERRDDYDDPSFFKLDLLMLDEAQDLRPSFYKALCHIIRKSQRAASAQQQKKRRRVMSNNLFQEEQTTTGSLQMCIVGDPKQMLYDFKTYGKDKATSQYMKEPQKYWGKYTGSREWIQTTLSTSYRLTPNIAAFVNSIWGTSIKGGNTTSPNLPVEYICRYPYPKDNGNANGGVVVEDRTRIPTSFFSDLIDEYGPENVMLLAQSVKSEACPIRVHVNELMKQKDPVTGKQKYNFHIKESIRGFEGNNDTNNKVRVWTFCGSKGCEAKVVVIMNFDCRDVSWTYSLNQVGVALSRATTRLIVIHGMSYVERELWPNHYYPMLGDQQVGMKNVLDFDDTDGECCYDVPPLPSSQGSATDVMKVRSNLTKRAMDDLSRRGIICLKKNGGSLPTHSKSKSNTVEQTVYLASDFNYFASSEEERFLYEYGTWIKESGVEDRIEYTSNIRFETTTEDVSALYGEAVVYSLQWHRQRYCPNIETVVNDGILRFERFTYYTQYTVRKQFEKKKCEPLSDAHEIVFCKKFAKNNKKLLRGDDLIRFINSGLIKLQKKTKIEGRTIYFPVKAAVEGAGEDKLMSTFLREIKSVYEKPEKSSAEWIYLANAVMAFGQYHDKWNQVGTNPKSYDTWVESDPLISAVDRLLQLMQKVEPSSMLKEYEGSADDDSAQKGFADDGKGGEFERDLLFEFSKSIGCSSDKNAALEVVGVSGICDWVGEGLVSANGHTVELLEIKFVHELGNVNRLQVLVYCALLSLERNKSCSGMLFNSRTCELEICQISVSKAKEFLSDISQFKLNGERLGD